MLTVRKIDSSDYKVSKFVFTGDDIAVEAVLYRYPTYRERTVICCSTQCGCPIGCSFCGTGKFFVRNLTADEIVEQITAVLSCIDCAPHEIAKFQIMFMSMGEPFLNMPNVVNAIRELHKRYPNAQLLVSTSYPKRVGVALELLMEVSVRINQVGLQFSVHESSDKYRQKIIPNANKLSKLAEAGEYWAYRTGRQPFFNYCVKQKNSKEKNVAQLLRYFDPYVWQATLSVICEKDKNMKDTTDEQMPLLKSFAELMTNAGYSVRLFNPAGTDDIGGGCGQLHYFQEWRKSR